MNLLLVSLVVIVALASVCFFLPNLAYAKDPCRGAIEVVDVKYEIRNGTVNSICLDREALSLIVVINATSNGTITLEIPRTIMNPVLSNCDDAKFFVLMDGEEILQNRKNTFGMGPFAEKKSAHSRTLIIPFTEPVEIEIIGIMLPEGLQYQKLCYQKMNAFPPRQQIADGVSAENVICKIGLQLIFKSKDNSPACVKPETKEKLVERGWGSMSIQTIQKTWVQKKVTQCDDPWDNPSSKVYADEWRQKHSNLSTNLSMDEYIITRYFGDRGIEIYQIKLVEGIYPSQSCEGCGCGGGSAWFFLVLKSNVDKMINLGFQFAENQSP